jgi:hypothetical protein
MNETKDHLAALLASPGWLLFKAHAEQEWAPAGCWRRIKEQQAVDPATPLGQQMLMIDYTNRMVGELMTWPAHRLKVLEAQAALEHPPQAFPRGGS